MCSYAGTKKGCNPAVIIVLAHGAHGMQCNIGLDWVIFSKHAMRHLGLTGAHHHHWQRAP
jgi:hypothetical protein